MAIAVQSVSTKTYDTGTTTVINKPSGLVIGDLMIAQITNAGQTITPPANWTLIVANSVGGKNSSIYWKIADASDVAGSTFTFTNGASCVSGGGILRIDGHYASSPINNYSSGTSGNNTDPSFTGFTPTIHNGLYIIFETNNEGQSVSGYAIATNNPTWTERWDFVGASIGMGCATASRPEVTATGNFTFHFGGNPNSIGQMIAIDSRVNLNLNDSLSGISDSKVVYIGVLKNETLTITENVSSILNKIKNLLKSVTTWTNQDKS